MDSVVICMYLRKSQRKCQIDLVQKLNILRDHSLRTFVAGKASLVIFRKRSLSKFIKNIKKNRRM